MNLSPRHLRSALHRPGGVARCPMARWGRGDHRRSRWGSAAAGGSGADSGGRTPPTTESIVERVRAFSHDVRDGRKPRRTSFMTTPSIPAPQRTCRRWRRHRRPTASQHARRPRRRRDAHRARQQRRRPRGRPARRRELVHGRLLPREGPTGARRGAEAACSSAGPRRARKRRCGHRRSKHDPLGWGRLAGRIQAVSMASGGGAMGLRPTHLGYAYQDSPGRATRRPLAAPGHRRISERPAGGQ
jgi:hypothetical protein